MAILNVNGKVHNVDVEPDTPLLWVLREQLGLTGTKYGCGIAQCGACTVHIDGVATRTCVRPVSTVTAAQKIVTIEGLSAERLASGAKSLGRARRSAMRVLPERNDHGGVGPACDEAQSHRCRHRRGDDQHLPLWHIQPRSRRDQGGGAGRRRQKRRPGHSTRRREHDMSANLSRRAIPGNVRRRGGRARLRLSYPIGWRRRCARLRRHRKSMPGSW